MANLPVLKYGDRNEAVRSMQILLKEKYDETLEVDGWFGVVTERTLKNFQRFNKITVNGVADGECGAVTWAHLLL